MLTEGCAFCGGSGDSHGILGGVNGNACFACLAEAFRSTALHYLPIRNSDATQQLRENNASCLICAGPASSTNLVLCREGNCICGDCLKRAFSLIADDGSQPYVVF